jgi:hypothetical protein
VAKRVDNKVLRSFGYIVGSGWGLLGLWPLLRYGTGVRWWAFLIAGALLLMALVAPQNLRSAYRAWMTLGHWLGTINTTILLTVVFYGIFTPMGVVMRLSGRDALRQRFDPHADTYRVVRQARPNTHLRRQF